MAGIDKMSNILLLFYNHNMLCFFFISCVGFFEIESLSIGLAVLVTVEIRLASNSTDIACLSASGVLGLKVCSIMSSCTGFLSIKLHSVIL